MSNSAQEPEENRIVDFRITLPALLTFVLTMAICYVLGQATTPYYEASRQSVRVDVIGRPADDGAVRRSDDGSVSDE